MDDKMTPIPPVEEHSGEYDCFLIGPSYRLPWVYYFNNHNREETSK